MARATVERVPLGVGALDAALGGGLARGSVHAVCAVCMCGCGGGVSDGLRAPYGSGGGCREAGPSARGGGRRVRWVVPFGALRFLATRAVRASNGAEARSIAWIGSAVHPAIAPCPAEWAEDRLPHDATARGEIARRSAGAEGVGVVQACDGDDDALLARHSWFVTEPPAIGMHGDGGVAGHAAAWRHGRKSGGKPGTMDESAAWRAWCAEEAIRSEAFAAIVVDASGVDARSWRRLHLAARSVGEPPLVILVHPPSCHGSSDGARFATTGWETMPAPPLGERCGPAQPDPTGDILHHAHGGRAWWLVLRRVKPSAIAARSDSDGKHAAGRPSSGEAASAESFAAPLQARSQAPSRAAEEHGCDARAQDGQVRDPCSHGSGVPPHDTPWHAELERGDLRLLLRSSRIRESAASTAVWSALAAPVLAEPVLVVPALAVSALAVSALERVTPLEHAASPDHGRFEPVRDRLWERVA